MMTEKSIIDEPVAVGHATGEWKYQKGYKVFIREAILDDRIALWEWRKDPVTRKIFNVNGSVDAKKHSSWFRKIMEDEGQILCVGSVSTVRVGCVWFDRHADGEYEVNIYIKPLYCGKGYAVSMLRESIAYLRSSRNARKLSADIRKINASSGRIFNDAGFACVQENESEMHYEMIL